MNEETAIEVRMDHVEIRLDKHEDVHKVHLSIHERLWDAIGKVQSRPPVWVTAVIGVLMTIVGWLLHVATT